MLIALFVILILALAVYLFLQQPQFGQLPKGERLQRIQQSPNYKNGAFQNLIHTPNMAEDTNFFSLLWGFIFEKSENAEPKNEIPTQKTDLHRLDIAQDVLVWFGHSSYLIQIDGKKILVDPVFSGAVSPLPFGNKAFKGANIYGVADMPEIDYLFISHDHWDHLDYQTIVKLKSKVKKVICGLGTAAHLEHWGYDKNSIIEKDWHEKAILEVGFTVHFTPARHFSGRGLQRNKALWVSFVLQTPSMQIFLGGDSGLDTHFKEIGEKFGGFDLAVLENGQYDRNWPYIHTLPHQITSVIKDLKAKRVLPVHSSKFTLAKHAWNEPLQLIWENSRRENIAILTPMIGEQVNLKDENQEFSKWW